MATVKKAQTGASMDSTKYFMKKMDSVRSAEKKSGKGITPASEKAYNDAAAGYRRQLTKSKAQNGAGVPKGYVRGEMTGKLIKKSVQDKWEKGMADDLDKQAGTGKYAKKPVAKTAPKAKDGKWIQKAINPKHKGYCTPMTKATCTPKRKALAKTLKAMGRARKNK